MTYDERLEAVRSLTEQSVFTGDTTALGEAETLLDAVGTDTALARGRVLHARHLASPKDARVEDPRELALFEEALTGYRRAGDGAGEAEAELWVGLVHQVVRADHDAAVPHLSRARELAVIAGDRRTASYALRHLGIAEHAAGHLTEARALLEQSTALRRELGFDAGVAANLVGLAWVALAEGRTDDARVQADEAAELAATSGATIISEQATTVRDRL